MGELRPCPLWQGSSSDKTLPLGYKHRRHEKEGKGRYGLE